MGQPISKEMMEELKQRPEVGALSDQHIWLTDGRVVDPSEYVVHVWPIVYVMKFVRCVCGGRHQGLIGKHVPLKGVWKVWADGRQERNRTDQVPFCNGQGWTEEEVVHRVEIASVPGQDGGHARKLVEALGLNVID